jgi:ribosomal protein S18 acetylase RimI-like enzyme
VGETSGSRAAGTKRLALRDDVLVRRLSSSDGMILKDVRLRALRANPESFTASLAEVERRPDDAWVAWASRLSRPDADEAVFAAFGADPRRAMGMAGVMLRGEPYLDSRVYGVWADPSVRGRGIARRLVHEVIEWARAAGRPRLTLCVMEASGPAIALYRSHGFEEEGCATASSVHEGASELAMVLRL